MTGIEHELLTKFRKMKPHLFHGSKIGDAFEFTIDNYERIHKLGIVQQHGIEFVTFQLQGDAKKWWRDYVEFSSPTLHPLTWA